MVNPQLPPGHQLHNRGGGAGGGAGTAQGLNDEVEFGADGIAPRRVGQQFQSRRRDVPGGGLALNEFGVDGLVRQQIGHGQVFHGGDLPRAEDR